MAKKSKKAAVKKTSAKSSTTKSKVKAKPVKATSKKSVALKANPKTKASASSAVRKAPASAATSRVIEYKLFTEDSVRSLEDQVNYLIKKGWAPVGGVVLQGQSTFTQTMVRHED